MYMQHIMTGILCGKCRDGKGLSALLDNCKSCGKINLLLIPTLGMSTVPLSEATKAIILKNIAKIFE